MKEACGLHCTKIENISVKLDGQYILKDVSFEIHCGELSMIIGKNGAGKSTLLKAILNDRISNVEHNDVFDYDGEVSVLEGGFYI